MHRNVLALVVGFCVLWGCDSNTDKSSPDTVGVDSAPNDAVVPSDVGNTSDLQQDNTVPPPEVLEDLPPATPQPPEPPEYGGTCPTFAAGSNTIMADGRKRSFEMFLPPHPKDNNTGLVFVWHGNGDSAKNLALFFQAQQAAEEYNTIVVAPVNCCNDQYDDCCDFSTTWNMGTYSKTEADLTVFDGILSCVDQQFNIDRRRVYTTGFSAGSLWSSFLVVNRGQYLAAATIFSGGTGLVVDYHTPGSKLPVLLAWGGSADTYMGVVNFETMTLDFSQNLRLDGHFVVECNHGLGHTVPYGGPTWGHRWLFAHQWGDEVSPFTNGLTEDFPSYCTIPE